MASEKIISTVRNRGRFLRVFASLRSKKLVPRVAVFMPKQIFPILLLCAAGCMQTRDCTTPPALSQKLERIDTIKLVTLSQEKPVSVQQATSNVVQKIKQPVSESGPIELTLEEVRKATLENNLRLKVELFAPSISQTVVDEERAKFEATFFGGASQRATESSDKTTDTRTTAYHAGISKPLPTGGRLATDVSFNNVDATGSDGVATSDAGISLVQPLLRGAGTRLNTQSIRIAQINRNIVGARTKLQMIHLLANADAAYWRLYAAQKELEVRQEQYTLAEKQLDYAHKKVAAGAAARIEIVRAEAGVASRLEAVINAENRVESHQRELRRIMNRPNMPVFADTQILPQTHPNPQGLELNRTSLIDYALDYRMEIIQLDMQMMIDEMDIRSARNQTLPGLNLTATYNLSGVAEDTSSSFNTLTDNASDNLFVGLSLNVPLGNRASKAQLLRSELSRLVHEAERNDQEQFIRQQVLETVSALETSWRRILAAQQGVEAAERDYQVEESQFQLGIRTSTDVLQAATRLADSQLSRIRAYADYEIARINLARATGTLLGYENIMIKCPLSQSALSGNAAGSRIACFE